MRTLFCCALMAVSTVAGAAMVDPAIDDPNKEWCYLAKSTVCIGVPYMPEPVQVTYDGAIYTRHAELCFFYGPSHQPVLARQKTFLEGWIPIVQYEWTDQDIAYSIEMFSFILDGQTEENTAQFVRLSAENTGNQPTVAVLASACRGSGGDYRLGASRLNPNAKFERSDNAWTADGKLVYCFPAGAEVEAVSGVPYKKPFMGSEYDVSPRAETGIAVYRFSLAPGERKTLDFRMPRVPVALNSRVAEKIKQAGYDDYRAKTVGYWRNLLGTKNILSCPEPRINDSYRAMTVHAMLGTVTRNGRRRQTDGLPYPSTFILSYYDMLRLYDQFGVSEVMRNSLPEMTERQQADGLIVDTSVTHGRMILASHGQVMSSLATHVFYTRDRAFAEEIYPVLRRAVSCIEDDHRANENGLMRTSEPFDAEMILGHYTSHNLWALTGLRNAIRVARFLGKDADVARWTELHTTFEKSVLAAIDASAEDDGYVPTGLYEFTTGPAARAGFAEYRTDQDWENCFLAWPCEVLAPDDPRVAGTVDRLRKTKYREGIMTYRNGQHLHQYVTVNSTMQDVVAGRDKKALIDIYHILLHAGSCHEAFENLVEPWSDRMVWASCPPPHCWGGSKIAGLVRNMFVFEHGGRGGLDQGERELYLFSVLSPDWAVPGETVSIEDALTEFGSLSAQLTFTAEGADIDIAGDFHTQPKHYVLRIPYFVKDVSFATLHGKGVIQDGWLRLTPDVSHVKLRWTVNPNADADTFGEILLAYRREVGHWTGKIDEHPEPPDGFLTEAEQNRKPRPLSVDLVRDAFTTEYARRLALDQKSGVPVTSVAAPKLLTPEERAQHGEPFKPDAPSLTTGKPATCSSHLAGYPPELANDGRRGDTRRHWAADAGALDDSKTWWQVDLEESTTVGRVVVVGYYGSERYYGFTVETSLDGKAWEMVADRRENKGLSTKEGYTCRFESRPVRYIRVT
ncbi:MAG: discoidin domain-containing protein, partial [Planctomycetes bacterium]|nr:discoidin domain-containing protein [Planctomycetota bacterium]